MSATHRSDIRKGLLAIVGTAQAADKQSGRQAEKQTSKQAKVAVVKLFPCCNQAQTPGCHAQPCFDPKVLPDSTNQASICNPNSLLPFSVHILQPLPSNLEPTEQG
jgi:hypothetical protein